MPASTDKAAEKELQRLRRLDDNKTCPNCFKEERLGFQSVCMAFRTFICTDCKSAHQSFSHRCKSTSQSFWTMEEVKSLDSQNGGGNVAARARWLVAVPEGQRPSNDSSLEVYKAFVEKAYIEERWAGDGMPPGSSEAGDDGEGHREKSQRKTKREHREGHSTGDSEPSHENRARFNTDGREQKERRKPREHREHRKHQRQGADEVGFDGGRVRSSSAPGTPDDYNLDGYSANGAYSGDGYSSYDAPMGPGDYFGPMGGGACGGTMANGMPQLGAGMDPGYADYGYGLPPGPCYDITNGPLMPPGPYGVALAPLALAPARSGGGVLAVPLESTNPWASDVDEAARSSTPNLSSLLAWARPYKSQAAVSAPTSPCLDLSVARMRQAAPQAPPLVSPRQLGPKNPWAREVASAVGPSAVGGARVAPHGLRTSLAGPRSAVNMQGPCAGHGRVGVFA